MASMIFLSPMYKWKEQYMQFDTKIAVVVRDDLEAWQKLRYISPFLLKNFFKPTTMMITAQRSKRASGRISKSWAWLSGRRKRASRRSSRACHCTASEKSASITYPNRIERAFAISAIFSEGNVLQFLALGQRYVTTTRVENRAPP